MNSEALANRIKQARIERSFTQQDLAKFLNKSASNVSDMERGRVQVSALDLYVLAQALNKSVGYFFEEPWVDGPIEDILVLLRNQTPEARQRSIEMMRIWMSLQTMQQELGVSDREPTPEEQQKIIVEIVNFLVQFEQMRQQVDALRAQLFEGLKEHGIDLAALLGGA
jgi:transcriptional regulator with XRE-family HTH domain